MLHADQESARSEGECGGGVGGCGEWEVGEGLHAVELVRVPEADVPIGGNREKLVLGVVKEETDDFMEVSVLL